MTEELYKRVLDVLVLGHIKYKETLQQLDDVHDFVLCYELQNDYSIDDYKQVVAEFINWYNKENNNV